MVAEEAVRFKTDDNSAGTACTRFNKRLGKAAFLARCLKALAAAPDCLKADDNSRVAA